MTSTKFWSRVDQTGPDGCWLWKGRIDRQGNGLTDFTKHGQLAHRVAWFLSYGAYPEQDAVRVPECRLMACVNPNHRIDGTQFDAMANASTRGTLLLGEQHHNGVKAECPSGHSYTDENVYMFRGRRYCKSCWCNDRRRAYDAARWRRLHPLKAAA